MNIRVNGAKASKLSVQETKQAVNFMSSLLMSPRLCNVLSIEIKFVNEFHDTTADVEWLDDNIRPREFKIRINKKRANTKKKMLQAIAHELVHVKQWASNEMRDSLKNSSHVRWKKEIINQDKIDYYDLPWEIEAYGRELGLYYRFKDYQKKLIE